MISEGKIASKDGTQLYYRRHTPSGPPKGRLMIVHGYGEHSGRYLELLEALAAAGIDALAPDLRGHGRSDGARAHIMRFGEYLEDCRATYHLLAGGSGEKVIVLGHSMGGLVATCFVLAEPQVCKALILSGPLFKRALKSNPLKIAAGHLFSKVVPKLALPSGITGDMVTHDPKEIEAYNNDPVLISNVRARWFTEMETALAGVPGRIGALNVPLIVFHGELDAIASIEQARLVFDRAGSKDKKFVALPGMRHEPLHEVERARIVKDIVAWTVERA